LGVGRAIGLGLSDCQALVHRPGITWDTQELLRACGLSVFEFDHLVEEQKPFGRHVTGTFASPAIDLKVGEGTYAEWLRGAYPGLAKTTLKKERRLGRDLGEMRFVYDERDPRVLRTLMRWKSAQYRRTGRMDRFARPWIVDLVDHLFRVREEHFNGVLSVLYAGDRPVAAHFGPTSRTLFAAWFTAYDPELRYYSPGLIMHLRMAEAAGREGVRLMDLGRGDKEWKDWLKTRELRVGEGFATRPHPMATAHRLWRRPVRGLRNTVLAHPRLRDPADRLLKTVGTLRTSGRPDSGAAGPRAR
jgi:CelD/BcsL family acetyltransferase involved in cellulose biosynthesis